MALTHSRQLMFLFVWCTCMAKGKDKNTTTQRHKNPKHVVLSAIDQETIDLFICF